MTVINYFDFDDGDSETKTARSFSAFKIVFDGGT